MVNMCVQILNCFLDIVHHENLLTRHHKQTLKCIHLPGIVVNLLSISSKFLVYLLSISCLSLLISDCKTLLTRHCAQTDSVLLQHHL